MGLFFVVSGSCLGEGLKSVAQERGIQLSREETETLGIGELGKTRYAIAGVFGIYPGFGLGHVVQGRWLSRGWIFTLGEGLGIVALSFGGIKCGINAAFGSDCNDNLLWGGILSFYGFKIWEIIDVWKWGYVHRKNYRLLERKINRSGDKSSFLILPQIDSHRAGLNFVLSF